MTTPREKFQKLLRELFQFDCADLDFGIYRIMNHKRSVIEQFIEKDLLNAVSEELHKGALAQEANAAERLAEISAQIKDTLGADALDVEGNLSSNYAATKIGKEYLSLRQPAGQAKKQTELESQIFNHLYSFFSRYYDQGDFMSLRRYSKREKYAIPYNGEEVYLHWANSDQYYIKTGENFTDYSYKHGNWTVRFKLRNADVEQNNVKGAKRFFIPKVDDLELNVVNRELIFPFEYRPLVSEEEAKFGKTNIQETITADALPRMLAAAELTSDGLAALAHEKRRDAANNPVSLLEHHLRTYTQKNTRDFFIHKDLKGFLERELDFYLKNEVLNLGELRAVGESRSTYWFHLLQTINSTGQRIIGFISQIENFQKQLYEKRKFVTEAHYCVTLDRVPRELYPEVARNEGQREEWVKFLHIDSSANNGYSVPLTIEFLNAHPFLTLDTRFFPQSFVDELLAGCLSDTDTNLDGVCIRSENFQALRLIEACYREQIRCVYIDPPYNTDAGPINYKNEYRSSSWVSLLENRLKIAKRLLSDDGLICITIDDYQVHELGHLLDLIFGQDNKLGVAIIRNNPSGRSTVSGFSICHEYAFFYRRTKDGALARLPRTSKQLERFSQEDGIHVDWRNFRKDGGAVTHRRERPKQFYPIYVNEVAQSIRIPKLSWNAAERAWDAIDKPKPDEVVVWPVDEKGKERVWSLNHISAQESLEDLQVRVAKNRTIQILRKHIPSQGVLPRSWWDKKLYAAREYGSAALLNLFGEPVFSFAKSPFAVQDCLWVAGLDYESTDWAIDFFAGSGTTAEAVLTLNRQDRGKRKFILVEAEDYFDTVLIPRVKKVIYSEKWRNGKPLGNKGVSCVLKCLRLESYEDALDNISFRSPAEQLSLQINDYVINYMLDFETKHSETFLNVSKLDSPFDYKLHRHGTDEPLPVDLPETFNYLIGLHVGTRRVYEHKGTRYLVYRGKSKERETAIIWRTTRDWGQTEFEDDRKFIEKEKLTEGAEDIFVNTDSFVPGARSLDPVFKRLMFNEE
jgi:adenine-specific DNA-methyltransferase